MAGFLLLDAAASPGGVSSPGCACRRTLPPLAGQSRLLLQVFTGGNARHQVLQEFAAMVVIAATAVARLAPVRLVPEALRENLGWGTCVRRRWSRRPTRRQRWQRQRV